MAKDVLITMVIPVYKVEEYLDKCMSSVVNQSYKNLEIILIDDGGQDNCPKMCDAWAKKDKRVKVIHKENGGLSDARNAGIKCAKGKYICFVDSDDFLHKDYVKLHYENITKYDADITICKYKDFRDESLIVDEEINSVDSVVFDKNELISEMFQRGRVNFITAWSKMYKKEIFDNLEFMKGRIHEDEFIVHRVFSLCDKAVFVPEVLYYYRQREGSIVTNKNFTERNLDSFYAIEDRYNFFVNTQFEELAYQCVLNTIIYCYCKAKYMSADKKFLKFYLEQYKKYYKMKKKKTKRQIVFKALPNLMAIAFKIKQKKRTVK